MPTYLKLTHTQPTGLAPAPAIMRWLALTVIALGAASHLPALAQSGKLGAYAGTVQVSGTGGSSELTYRATVKLSLPVTERNANSITADFLTDEAPNASVLLSQWDTAFKQKSADSDGKFSSWTCALAAPVEIPMKPTGILNVDQGKKNYALSVTLLSLQEVAFNCVHSRSGAFKKKKGITLYIGTGLPGAQAANPLPLTDPARLAAKHTLTPSAELKAEYGPIVQEWDLRLTR